MAVVPGRLVNVKDNRFHQQALLGSQGQLLSSIATNAGTRQLAGSVDGGFGNSELSHIAHVDFFLRDADNYVAGEQNGRNVEIQSSASKMQGQYCL